MERREAVGAVVVGRDGHVLLVKRGRAPARGSWTLPGGKLEPGETLADAIHREVLEETGIRLRATQELTVVPVDGDGFAYSIHEHVCAPTDPFAAPRPGDDAEDARWVGPEDFGALGLSDAVRAVISLALARARELKW